MTTKEDITTSLRYHRYSLEEKIYEGRACLLCFFNKLTKMRIREELAFFFFSFIVSACRGWILQAGKIATAKKQTLNI